MGSKSAAISADKLADTRLEKLSAAEFLSALHDHKAVELVRYWPEKKKYELEVEPVLERLKLRDFIEIVERIRDEKKKTEYEVPDIWRWRVNPAEAGLESRVDQLAQQLDSLADKIDSLR